MGIGLLSLPYSLHITGWFVGISLLILFSLMTRHTAILLQKLLDIDNDKLAYSYSDIGEMAFGMKGRVFISIIFFLELFAVKVC
jgi:vesicular inhibitory amino acid transporter